jgi:hypothetical protein
MQRNALFLVLTVTLGTLMACGEGAKERPFDYWDSVGEGNDGVADESDTSDSAVDDGSVDDGSEDSGSEDGDPGDGDGDADGDGDGDGDGDQPPEGGDQMCVPVSVAADVLAAPADIIVIVDNSNSMTQESAFVQIQLNAFSAQLELSGVDHHIVLISSYPHEDKGICVPPPLGGGGCPNYDDNPPLYRHVDQMIGGHNALAKLISTENEWEDSMRPDSMKHIVVVSDGESQLGGNAFAGQFHALDESYDSFVLHAIVCAWDCPEASDVGQVYIDLASETGGMLGDLCQQDFQTVFDELANAVIQKLPMSCHFDIPPPPMGMNLDHTLINVELDDGGNLEDIPGVVDLADCMNEPDGWYYDDPGDPAQILLCPQTCEKAQAYEMGAINVKFGCETLTAK